MEIGYSRTFTKSFKRFPRTLQQRIVVREKIFRNDRRNPLLKDHALAGEFEGCSSYSITGDVRVIYRFIDLNKVVFLDVGTHHELYGS